LLYILEKLVEFKHIFGHNTELILPKEVFWWTWKI